MRPSRRLVGCIAVCVVLGVGASLRPMVEPVWFGAAGLLAVLAVVDWVLARLRTGIEFEREAPEAFALHVESGVTLRLSSSSRREVVRIFDGIPGCADTPDLPLSITLASGQGTEVTYRLRFRERGEQRISSAHIERESPLGLWAVPERAGEEAIVRVLPNFSPVIRYALLGVARRRREMGIRVRPRPGISQSFHQLRDYREGDLVQHIDWKATSRRRALISREYREERNQEIVFLLDSGRRMRSLDGDLSQFDHCLNATLLLAHIALGQGDAVGLITFGGDGRWTPPVRSASGLGAFLRQIYDYQPTLRPSDFDEAARRVLEHQRRRAMIILLTNLRGEDEESLVRALGALRRRHLVVVASLGEESVDAAMKRRPTDFESALTTAAASAYRRERARVVRDLSARGITTIDTTARRLPVELANLYLDVKRVGRL